MRKLSTMATLMTLLALFTFGTTALAGNCGSKAADATCGTFKSAGSSCAGKASAEAAGLSCHGKADASSSDFFISSYMKVKSGLHKGCCASTESAVSAWKSGVEKMLENGEAAEHQEHLKNLVQVLDSWPADIDAQRSSFEKLSNWTIGYMEMFPERCDGAEVKSCSKSGHRWVETQDVAGDPYSS